MRIEPKLTEEELRAFLDANDEFLGQQSTTKLVAAITVGPWIYSGAPMANLAMLLGDGSTVAFTITLAELHALHSTLITSALNALQLNNVSELEQQVFNEEDPK